MSFPWKCFDNGIFVIDCLRILYREIKRTQSRFLRFIFFTFLPLTKNEEEVRVSKHFQPAYLFYLTLAVFDCKFNYYCYHHILTYDPFTACHTMWVFHSWRLIIGRQIEFVWMSLRQSRPRGRPGYRNRSFGFSSCR